MELDNGCTSCRVDFKWRALAVFVEVQELPSLAEESAGHVEVREPYGRSEL
jgi:hypothetical protein